MCSLLHAPEPDDQAVNIRQSEENLPTGHGVLTQLAHEKQPKPLCDEAQAAVVTLFKTCTWHTPTWQKWKNLQQLQEAGRW